MGIIKRQSIKYSIVQYIGIVVGAVSMLAVYPRALDVYGLVQALISAASVVTPFVLLGSTVMSVRYFPVFRDKTGKHNGFLGLMILVALTGTLLFAALFPWIKRGLEQFFLATNKPVWYTEFLPFVLPLVVGLVFTRLFALHASNFQRIVIPAILEDFLIKIVLPILILGYVFWHLKIEWVVGGVVLNYALAAIGMLVYLRWLGQWYWRPQFHLLTPRIRKKMASYAGFGILNGLGTKAAFYIDTLMVSGMMNLTSTGVYGIGRFIGDILAKPIKSIIGISQPIIAKAIEEGDMAEVEKIYKKSSINLLILGVFLFAGIWICLDFVFEIMPNTGIVRQGKYVVFFLCLANLTNMATSVNNEVINYSPYYKFNFIALLALAVFNVICNLYFIPRFEITGAALATFTSLTLFNIVKLIFIYLIFKIQPFTLKTPLIPLTGLIVYGIAYLVPVLSADAAWMTIDWLPTHLLSSAINILIKGGVIFLLYPWAIYKLKISKEYDEVVDRIIEQYFPFLRPIF